MHLNNIKSSNHKHRISFQFFKISLSDVLQFSLYKSFTSLIKLMPKYCIPFDAIANVNVFLIFFSGYSLLAYRNATGFNVLILYLATLLNSFISYNSFCGIFMVCFSTYKFISSGNRDNFTSSFLVWFISLSYLIAWARTSNTVE